MTAPHPSPRGADAGSRERIVVEARREFAARGFAAARLQDIAERAGLAHPTLLYHFGSKERLYAAVIEAAVEDWAASTRGAITTGLHGFAQVAALLEACFAFFARNPDFVTIVRREAMEGADRLEEAIGADMRPFLDQAVAFLERETRAGRLRPHEPLELMQLCYGAVLSCFSDAPLRSRLCGDDPLEPVALARYRDALTATLRAALEPDG